ncbi:hypothetical protein C6P40_001178 [Pichia californica]|uniref:FAR-17a/AIG1-like protein n=1 Tax=Pichia californica TaxID=460514 RepID=A0A9P7BEV8_9ASCO|nr:hypothetical protein C6P42_003954 [[Candida] californica]KAG0688291.1 hypothetical protein C6P40_001178 [[Candida] californica]
MSDKNIGNPVPILMSAAFVAIAATAFQTLHGLELPPNLEGGGHYQFLTNLALCLSTLYFSVNLLYHVLKLKELKTLKVYLSATCLSLNFIVSSVYWSLKIFVPYLIISDEATFPFSLDLKIHLMPLLCTAIDYFVYMRRWDIPYLTGYLIVTILTIAYWFWLDYLITEDASYPYPFLNVETNLRIIIFAVISLVAFGSFCFGKLMHPDFIPELNLAEKDFSKKE